MPAKDSRSAMGTQSGLEAHIWRDTSTTYAQSIRIGAVRQEGMLLISCSCKTPQLQESTFGPGTHALQVAEDARRLWGRPLQDGGQEGARRAADVQDAAVLRPLVVLHQSLGTCVSGTLNLPHVPRHAVASLQVSHLTTLPE